MFKNMPVIYFGGQDNFGNRGCEALIRSIVKTIRAEFPDAQFLVPSHNLPNDAKQWPQAQSLGVEFISAEPIPSSIRWWGRIRRWMSFFDAFPPTFTLTASTRAAIQRCDVVVMTGGDIISLDYGLESLYFWVRICEAAMEMGKPVVLWAASVGPFKHVPSVEKRIARYLRAHSMVSVRETTSLEYLKGLGITNTILVADPAFVLDLEEPPASVLPAFCHSDTPVLGFNVSPLLRKFREGTASQAALDEEIKDFLVHTLVDLNINVLLIPHVDPLTGSADNSDSVYMSSILDKVRAAGLGEDRIAMLPRMLNTAQLKGVIGRCSYFMGARTHATIAALSLGIPTTSIAYSIKAKGINQDLFGHLRYVLETPSIDRASLRAHLQMLINERDGIKQMLSERIPIWKRNAQVPAGSLKVLFVHP